MNIVERQELADTLKEMKELLDEVLPIESSVVKDQILMTLMASTIQGKLMEKQAPLPGMLDFMGMATGLKEAIESADKTVAASLTMAASRMVQEEDKLGPETAQGWAWEAYQYFLGMIKVV